MSLPFSFGAVTTAQTPWLDSNFAALGALTAIPCAVAGTNTLTLTPQASTPTIAAYVNYQPFSGIAANTNGSAVTAQVGGLAALNVYKDTASGPIALSGGEITAGNLIYLTYDGALNTGSGGFHLMPAGPTAAAAQSGTSTISSTPGVTLTAAQVTGNGTGQAIILRQGSPVGGYNDQTPAASAIIAAIAGAVTNTVFRIRVVNTSGQTQTLTAGASVTVAGTATTATATTHDFLGVVTGASTVTIYG